MIRRHKERDVNIKGAPWFAPKTECQGAPDCILHAKLFKSPGKHLGGLGRIIRLRGHPDTSLSKIPMWRTAKVPGSSAPNRFHDVLAQLPSLPHTLR